MDRTVREKKITQTSLIGIAVNLLLVAFKSAVGLLSGSIAILLDAVNNLTDAFSSVVTILGVKLAGRKPDQKHPFGYGRIEYFSTIIIAAVILAAGATALVEAVKKIITPEMPDYSAVTLAIVAVAVAAKLLLGSFVKKQGKKYNSDALVASGADASFDAVLSASTLLGGLVTLLFRISVDGVIGAVIAVFILKAGMELLLESIGNVMGSRPDSETTKAIRETVGQVEGVLGAYDLILHNYGPDSAIGSIHVEIPDVLTAGEIHRITRQIQEQVLAQFRVFLTVGVYAVDSRHTAEREQIHACALRHPGVLGAHGVYFDSEQKTVSFDVTVDFTVKDKTALMESLRREVGTFLPGYTVVINCDADYSD